MQEQAQQKNAVRRPGESRFRMEHKLNWLKYGLLERPCGKKVAEKFNPSSNAGLVVQHTKHDEIHRSAWAGESDAALFLDFTRPDATSRGVATLHHWGDRTLPLYVGTNTRKYYQEMVWH